MADRYHNFAALAANEKLGTDYCIRYENRDTPFVILAPHGGRIEPGTAEITEAIAGTDLSFYIFEVLSPAGDRGSLHITSTNFDEPQALALVNKAQKAIAIHGRADRHDPLTALVGGRDVRLRDGVITALMAKGFCADIATKDSFPGNELANICNRTRSGEGVQLELPSSLRRQLRSDATLLRTFCQAIRDAISSSSTRR